MALTDEQKRDIQRAYSQWLKSNGFKPRQSQREMIAFVANVLANVEVDEDGKRSGTDHAHLALAEAGTGTGKTIAYAIPAIVLAKSLEKKLVISTATIALQEQLIASDLPNLHKHSGLEFSFALAKGRGRYLCLNKSNWTISSHGSNANSASLFPDELPSFSESEIQTVRDVNVAFYDSSWNGDRDDYPGQIDNHLWRRVAADHGSCTGKKCEHFSRCALFAARDTVRDADVIVANHDLVLANLAAGESGVLPDSAETIYLFDEAHHLPEKSRNHRSASIAIDKFGTYFQGIDKHLSKWLREKDLTPDLGFRLRQTIKLVNAAQAVSVMLYDALDTYLQHASDLDVIDGAETIDYRLKNASLNQSLGFDELENCAVVLSRSLEKLREIIQAASEVEDDKDPMLAKIVVLSHHLDELNRIQSVSASYAKRENTSITSDAPDANWISVSANSQQSLTLSSAPLDSAKLLTENLWSKCFAAVMTSATLAPLGDFRYFIKKIGHVYPEHARRIASSINYQQASFIVPAMQSEPNNTLAHTQELIDLLPSLCGDTWGVLVLFASRRQMEEVFDALSADLSAKIIKQGTHSKYRLIEQHKSRVDAGEQSIIFGLSSFAEGLDLPGSYCELVVIAKLPFSVPNSPIELALKEWVESNGGDAFRDISLPEASLRLMQSCGRLMRKESDSGRIVLLDKRVNSKWYGKQLLSALPPYHRSAQ